MKVRFSANLGFLWKELPLDARMQRAAVAGFAAVELHDDWLATDCHRLRGAIDSAGLAVTGINCAMHGRFGFAACPDETSLARADIAQAIEAASILGAAFVHVPSGITPASAPAMECFQSNLDFACDLAARHALRILIEPIAKQAVPGYFLCDLERALGTIAALGRPELQLMFDCFHIHAMGHDLVTIFTDCVSLTGHIQIAGLPDRAEPRTGGDPATDYARLLPAFMQTGYTGSFGCEYRPAKAGDGRVEAGLGWMEAFT